MEMGLHRVEIASTSLAVLGDKPAIRVVVRFADGEETDVVVWLTEKAIGIARQQLKKCGFDPDMEDLQILDDDPTRLAGNKIDIIVEEFNGKLRAQIPLKTTPSKKEVTRLQGLLRSIKKDDPAPKANTSPHAEGAVLNPISGEPMEDDIPFNR